MLQIFTLTITIFVIVTGFASDQKSRGEMVSDIRKFCGDTIIDLLKDENDELGEIYHDRELEIDYAKVGFGSFSPWTVGLIPIPGIRQKMFELRSSRKEYARNTVLFLNLEDLKNKLNGKSPLPESKKGLFIMPLQREANYSENFEKANHPLVMLGVCSTISLLHANECRKGLQTIVKYMTPMRLTMISTGAPLFEEILTQEKYIEGLRLAAVKILEKFESGNVDANSDLFTDIHESFSSYMNRNDAEELTWKVLALISTSGANLAMRLYDIEAESKFEMLKLALTAIAIAMPYLDSLMLPYDRTYSLPKSIQTSCDFGKPYHFWMTAYLARHLVKHEKINSGAAAMAAYLSQKGYEIASQTSGRDPAKIFALETFSSWNNMLRMDIAHSAAASIYGAARAKNKNVMLSVDDGLKSLIATAEEVEPMDYRDARDLFEGTGAKAFLRWQKIISPESAFNLFYKEL